MPLDSVIGAKHAPTTGPKTAVPKGRGAAGPGAVTARGAGEAATAGGPLLGELPDCRDPGTNSGAEVFQSHWSSIIWMATKTAPGWKRPDPQMEKRRTKQKGRKLSDASRCNFQVWLLSMWLESSFYHDHSWSTKLTAILCALSASSKPQIHNLHRNHWGLEPTRDPWIFSMALMKCFQLRRGISKGNGMYIISRLL